MNQRKALGFNFLRKCGTGVMHLVVITICLSLTACSIYGAHVMSAQYFHPAIKYPLMTIYYYLVLNYLSAYALAVFSDPGRPPQRPEDTFTPRCQKCNLLKPIRAHHCTICGQCCLKYDHHCPWVANCVGLRNYGYFLKFLGVGFIASTLSFLIEMIALLTKRLCQDCTPGQRVMSNIFILMFTGCSIMCTALMFFAHLPYIKFNQTTVESYDNDFEKARAKRNGVNYEFPYDKGFKKNLEEIFGKHILLSLTIPFWINKLQVDGLSYVQNKNIKL